MYIGNSRYHTCMGQATNVPNMIVYIYIYECTITQATKTILLLKWPTTSSLSCGVVSQLQAQVCSDVKHTVHALITKIDNIML